MTNRINILFADDHPLFIQGVVSMLNGREDVNISAVAHDGSTALQYIRKLKPDIAFLDIEMPQPDGFKVAQTIIAEKLPTKIVFLTMFNEESFIRKGFKLGIKGYILKEDVINEINECIDCIKTGALVHVQNQWQGDIDKEGRCS